jgi:hypothetical protein
MSRRIAHHDRWSGDVEVLKQGSRLAFANCYISAGEQRIVRASAVFLVTGQLDTSASV